MVREAEDIVKGVVGIEEGTVASNVQQLLDAYGLYGPYQVCSCKLVAGRSL